MGSGFGVASRALCHLCSPPYSLTSTWSEMLSLMMVLNREGTLFDFRLTGLLTPVGILLQESY